MLQFLHLDLCSSAKFNIAIKYLTCIQCKLMQLTFSSCNNKFYNLHPCRTRQDQWVEFCVLVTKQSFVLKGLPVFVFTLLEKLTEFDVQRNTLHYNCSCFSPSLQLFFLHTNNFEILTNCQISDISKRESGLDATFPVLIWKFL